MKVLLQYCFIIIFVFITSSAFASSARTKPEFRGVWIATVDNIDWPCNKTSSTKQNKADLVSMLDKFQDANFNAVIFQVRPAGDAFYKSQIEPWSTYLTGHQGRAPSPYWDPLEFLVRESHKRNMEVHAWFNPYRAKAGSRSFAGLSSKNMAKAFPEAAYPYGKDIWMDPSYQPVQDRAVDVVMDVVKRYDVDGVHIDDYFYPYPTKQPFPDAKFYQAYKQHGGKLSLGDWRRNNVNVLVHRISQKINETKHFVKFGISPFGVWKSEHPPTVHGFSAYDKLYCDARMWMQKGWLDYITPQLYWRIGRQNVSFTDLAEWWSDQQQNPQKHHIYIGMGDYKVNQVGWGPEEIIRQVNESRIRANRTVLGDIHFSAKLIYNNVDGLYNLFKEKLYETPALVPKMPWKLSNLAAHSPPHVATSNGNLVTWTSNDTMSVRSWLLYRVRLSDKMYILTKVFGSSTRSARLSPGVWVLSTLDRLGRQADSQDIKIPHH